ncbi:hypothetical protein HJFPF1_13640 [Paramyrothecium foliicola]|nr:hypothetical protein HJFPF1_13640 [Paramyrothecium foliicola]
MQDHLRETTEDIQLKREFPKTTHARIVSMTNFLRDGAKSREVQLHRFLCDLLAECGPSGYLLCVATYNKKSLMAKSRREQFSRIKELAVGTAFDLLVTKYNIPASIDDIKQEERHIEQEERHIEQEERSQVQRPQMKDAAVQTSQTLWPSTIQVVDLQKLVNSLPHVDEFQLRVPMRDGADEPHLMLNPHLCQTLLRFASQRLNPVVYTAQ